MLLFLYNIFVLFNVILKNVLILKDMDYVIVKVIYFVFLVIDILCLIYFMIDYIV